MKLCSINQNISTIKDCLFGKDLLKEKMFTLVIVLVNAYFM